MEINEFEKCIGRIIDVILNDRSEMSFGLEEIDRANNEILYFNKSKLRRINDGEKGILPDRIKAVEIFSLKSPCEDFKII